MREYSWVMMTHVGGSRPSVMSFSVYVLLSPFTLMILEYVTRTHPVAVPSLGRRVVGYRVVSHWRCFDLIGLSDLPTLSSCLVRAISLDGLVPPAVFNFLRRKDRLSFKDRRLEAYSKTLSDKKRSIFSLLRVMSPS